MTLELGPVAPPDPPLSADGVTLRQFALKDVPALVAACNDAAIAHYQPVPSPYSDEDARAYVAAVSGGFETGRSLNFAGVDGRDRLLGSFGLARPLPEARVIEVGYWVAPWARGGGIATTATRLLARWALTDLGYERVELYTAADNAPSQRVAEKAGFTREGLLRERELTRDGSRRDMVVFGLLAREVPTLRY